MKLKMFLVSLFFSIFIGVTIIVVQLHHNVQLRTIIEKKIQKEIQEFCKCRYKAELGTVTVLNPSVTLENVTLYDNDSQWSITLDKLVFETSWLSFLQYGTFLITCTLDAVTVNTQFSGMRCAIISHFSSLFQTPQKPITYITPHRLNIVNASLIGTNPSIQMVTTFKANGSCIATNNNYVSSGLITDSSITLYDKPLLHAISGQWAYNSTIIENQRYHTAIFMGKTDLEVGPDKERECTLEVIIDKTRTLHLHNSSTLDLACTMNNNYTYSGTATLPCKYLQQFIGFTQEEIAGTTHATYSGDLYGKLQATIDLKNVGMRNYTIPSVIIEVDKKESICEGTYIIADKEKRAAGEWQYNFATHHFNTTLTNTKAMPLLFSKDWLLEEKSLSCSCKRNEKGIEGEYTYSLKHTPTDTKLTINGDYTYDNKSLHTNGMCNSYRFEGIIDIIPALIPRTFKCLNENKQPLITYQHTSATENNFEMNVSYDLFYNALEQFADYSLPGTGDLHITGAITKGGIKGSIEAVDALIRIPEMYNFLSQFKTDFSIQYSPFIIQCKHFNALLHKGSIQSQSLTFGYDQDNFFMHLPLQFNKCLLNKKNSLFAQMSGTTLLAKKRNEGPELSGTVIIEKGHMRENPFSLEGQQDVTNSILPSVIFEDKPLNLHIHIFTKEPLVIKTPQIASQAQCDVTIINTLQEPHFKGTLGLVGGTIEFPYKPLTITTAHIYFVPNGRKDHQLEIVAQGSIKNYTVMVTVTGTIHDPHIALTSSPTLPEEQIISLLYTGSTQDSLNAIIPTFLTTNIQQRILGAAQQNDPTKYSWLDTFKRIHIVPSFADQSGRGGFRGTIEIDISDHLRATLQKNFSLSEDTRIEVEYDASDDIVIKGIKDERSDIGAEVEMRFKF